MGISQFAPGTSCKQMSIGVAPCCMLLLAHAASCPSFDIVSLSFSLATVSPHPSMILAACNIIGKHVMGILADGNPSWDTS